MRAQTPQVFLGLGKISKNILEKVFFFILSRFFLIWDFVPKNVKNDPSERWNFFFPEIGHIGYKKESILCWLSDKMLPKKVKIKKQYKLGQISTFQNGFLILTFFENFVTKANEDFLNQRKIIDFLNTQYDIFQKIFLSPLRGAVFKIFGHRTPIKEETASVKKNAFSKTF
jgi:hypothetical protein